MISRCTEQSTAHAHLWRIVVRGTETKSTAALSSTTWWRRTFCTYQEFGELFAAGSADLREKQCCGNNTLFTSWDSYKVFFFMNQRYMFLSTFEHNRTQTPQRNTFWNDKQWVQRTADVKGPSKENIFASLRSKWIVKNTKKSMTSHLKQLIPKVFVQYWTIISPNI